MSNIIIKEEYDNLENQVIDSAEDIVDIISDMNTTLSGVLLDRQFITAESGINIIRKIMSNSGYYLPAFYNTDVEGEEIVIALKNVEGADSSTMIYIIYAISDEGYYEFFAETGSDARMIEILDDNEDEDDFDLESIEDEDLVDISSEDDK